MVSFHNICKSSDYIIHLKLTQLCQLYLNKTGGKYQGEIKKKQVVEEGFKPSVATERASVLPLSPAAAL